MAGLITVSVQILSAAPGGPSTVQDLPAATASPLASNVPLGILVDLGATEKGGTPQSADAVAAAAAEPLMRSMPTPAAVNSLSFSPNGMVLASSDVNGEILLHDLATGAATPLGGNIVGPFDSIAFSPDGKMLAGGDDNLAFLADLAGGTVTPLSIEDYGAGGVPTSVAFSPDGGTLAVGTFDGQILLRDLADATNTVLISGGTVTGLAFSPGGTMLAIGDADGKVSIHRFHHFVIGENTTFDYGGQVSSVAFSPDGQLLASGDRDGQVFIHDFATGATTTLVTGGSVTSVTFSPDGQMLAIGDSNGQVFLYDPASKAATSLGADSAVGSLAFSPDGSTLATADASQIDLWSVTGVAAELGLGGNARSVAFSPDSKILASGYADGQIVLDNIATGTRRTLDDGSPVDSIAVSPDGKLLATGDEYGLVLYNLLTGTSRTFWNTNNTDSPAPDTSVAFSPDGKLLAVTGSGVFVYNVSTGLPTINGSDVSGNSYSVAYGQGGNALAISTDNGVYLLNPRTGLQDPEVREGGANLAPDGGSSVSSLAYSPDGKTLAVGDAAGNVTLYSLASREPTATLADGSPVSAVAYSPDGQWLASGTASGEIILHNVVTGKQITQDAGTDVTSLTFSPDGRWLASATRPAGTWASRSTCIRQHCGPGQQTSPLSGTASAKRPGTST